VALMTYQRQIAEHQAIAIQDQEMISSLQNQLYAKLDELEKLQKKYDEIVVNMNEMEKKMSDAERRAEISEVNRKIAEKRVLAAEVRLQNFLGKF
jgi:septal ring factor EnvC (AmiA/AmiB activator)